MDLVFAGSPEATSEDTEGWLYMLHCILNILHFILLVILKSKCYFHFIGEETDVE